MDSCNRKHVVYQKISENFIRQMRNWALTCAGSGGTARVISSIYRALSAPGDSYGQSHEPVLIGEAEDVNLALGRVPVRYRQAVCLFWQFEGRTTAWLAHRCGAGVDPRTYKDRVVHGHELLQVELWRDHARAEEYRAAVKKLGIIS